MKVKCPQCNMEYEVEESMRGQKFNCLNENCSGIIGVPKPFSSQNNRAGRQSTADRYNTASTLPSTLLWDMHDCFSLQKKCIWGILISMVLFIVFLFALESAEDEVRHCEYKLSYAQMDVRMATNDVIFAYDRDEKDEAESKLRQAETYLDTCKREFDSAENTYDFVLIIFWISLVLCVISIIVFPYSSSNFSTKHGSCSRKIVQSPRQTRQFGSILFRVFFRSGSGSPTLNWGRRTPTLPEDGQTKYLL